MKEQSLKVSKKFKMLFLAVFLTFLTVTPSALLSQTGENVPALNPSQIEQIEKFIQRQMRLGSIPGMSVIIVKGDQTLYKRGFGFADMGTKEEVTAATLFELGSCSKAFTGLAILRLEEQGFLNLSDPVEKYIPWLRLKYRGKEVQVTVSHFLHQTSGIHFKTIGDIPEAEGDDALEKTVRILAGIELNHPPGQKLLYATINYDVLGLIIQEVSGQSYEEYIKKNILEPLQLNNTYLFRKDAQAAGMATGYKLCFKKQAAYNAPVYRGNTPAGYVITNSDDLARWLKIQMGTSDPGTNFKGLIEKSHITDPQLPNSNYAAGWFVLKNYGMITHSGTNPNFSASITFAAEKVGIAVLANTNSNFIIGTGRGLLAMLRGGIPQPSLPDMNQRFDSIAFIIVLVFGFLILLAVVLLVFSIIKIAGGRKKFSIKGAKKAVGFIIATVLLAAVLYLITIIPALLGYDLPLSFGFVWLPFTFTYAVLAIFLAAILYYLYFLSLLFFSKQKA